MPAQGNHSSIFTDTAVQRTYYVKAVWDFSHTAKELALVGSFLWSGYAVALVRRTVHQLIFSLIHIKQTIKDIEPICLFGQFFFLVKRFLNLCFRSGELLFKSWKLSAFRLQPFRDFLNGIIDSGNVADSVRA